MSPSRRREAVRMLGERLGVSERRACRITGQHRSTQRHQPRRTDRDDALRSALRELSRAHPEDVPSAVEFCDGGPGLTVRP